MSGSGENGRGTTRWLGCKQSNRKTNAKGGEERLTHSHATSDAFRIGAAWTALLRHCCGTEVGASRRLLTNTKRRPWSWAVHQNASAKGHPAAQTRGTGSHPTKLLLVIHHLTTTALWSLPCATINSAHLCCCCHCPGCGCMGGVRCHEYEAWSSRGGSGRTPSWLAMDDGRGPAAPWQVLVPRVVGGLPPSCCGGEI